MNLNLIGEQIQAQPMVMALRENLMAIRDEAITLYRRYRLWILAGAALLVVVFAGWMIGHRQSDNALSAEFRTSAQQAYEAISSCENYKPHRGDSWQVRELDAELSVAGAVARAKTHADLRAAMALSDYLHEVKLVHMARQIQDPKSARHTYAELRAAKQKAHSAIKVS